MILAAVAAAACRGGAARPVEVRGEAGAGDPQPETATDPRGDAQGDGSRDGGGGDDGMGGEAIGPEPDSDGDGIPDPEDVLAGAIACASEGADYDSGYFEIDYPMGDVPRDKGCCTDVVIRAFRNAGIDLQEAIHEDIVARPEAYPWIGEPNTSIDHRRVRNMLVYMKTHMAGLCTSTVAGDGCEWLPGDVAFFDTLDKKGPDHVGIVSSEIGGSGMPTVINSWTWGWKTQAMDLLDWCKVTHHFRPGLLPGE